MSPCDELLTKEELKRNSHGPMLIYTYTQEDLGIEKLFPLEYRVPTWFLLCVYGM